MIISAVVAVSENGIIGKDGKLPWKIPEEQAVFRKLTMGHHILMGRVTQESIGRPLKGRVNMVLSMKEGYKPEGFLVFNDLNDAIKYAKDQGEEELMVIGGEQIYRLTLPLAEKIYLSIVKLTVEGDTRFPEINENDWKVIESKLHSEGETPFETRILERRG